MCVLEAGLFGKHPRDRPRGKPPRSTPPRCKLPRRRPRRRKPPRSTPLRCKPLRDLPPRGAAFRMYGTAPVPYVWNEPVFQMWATLSFWTAGFQDAAICIYTLWIRSALVLFLCTMLTSFIAALSPQRRGCGVRIGESSSV